MLIYLINNRYSCQLLCSDKCTTPERIEFVVEKEKERERERERERGREGSFCQKKLRSR
jgi:hypothetical protein